jgi:hypothetical protein
LDQINRYGKESQSAQTCVQKVENCSAHDGGNNSAAGNFQYSLSNGGVVMLIVEGCGSVGARRARRLSMKNFSASRATAPVRKLINAPQRLAESGKALTLRSRLERLAPAAGHTAASASTIATANQGG